MTEIPFYPWWRPCRDYQSLMESFSLSREEFKSFPSGHTTYASLLLIPVCFMPLGNPKTEKLQIRLFWAVLAFVLLVGLARVLVGAHYVSDVSVGVLITLLSLLLANELVIRIKSLHQESA